MNPDLMELRWRRILTDMLEASKKACRDLVQEAPFGPRREMEGQDVGTCSNSPSGWCDDLECVNGCKAVDVVPLDIQLHRAMFTALVGPCRKVPVYCPHGMERRKGNE